MATKPLPPTKLSLVRAAYEAGDFAGALRIAAKFPELGESRDAVQRGHQAFVRPDFVREIGRDVAADRAAGIAALAERYGFENRPITGELP